MTRTTLALRVLQATLLAAGIGTAEAQVFGPPQLMSTSTPAADPRDSYPQIATDRAGTWIATWESEGVAGSGGDSDIVISRSLDNGATWTAPVALNSNATTDTGDDYGVQIATDGVGNWVATWTSDDNFDGMVGGDADIAVARSTDNGATWTAPASLASNATSEHDFLDFWPQLATDGSGNWVVIWTDYRSGIDGSNCDISVSRSTDNGATWTPTASIYSADLSGESVTPHLATDGAGNWLATWSAKNGLAETLGTDFDILVSRSTDNGATWTASAALDANAAVDAAQDERPRIATDGAGHWVATWDRSENYAEYEVLVARSTDNGATWTAPADLNATAGTDIGNDLDSEIVTDGNGNWFAVWSADEGNGTDWDLMAAGSTDNGATWTAPAVLNTNAAIEAADHWTARVATDGAGHWVAAWYLSDEAQQGLNPYRVDVYIAAGGICGDGTLAGSEGCDDGGQVSGDCCSSTCVAESAGNACASDDVACTNNLCDGTGGCGVADDSLCDDHMACTVDRCDVDAGCQFDAEPVDDSVCLVAGRTKLQIKDSADGDKDKLTWQWSNGEGFDQSDLGNPLVATSYTLCVYDMDGSVPSLASSLELPASPTLWTDQSPKGLLYRDSSGANDGVRSVKLKTGVDRNSVTLSARGAGVPLPGAVGSSYFQQSPSVIVQLHNGAGTCWTSSFAADDTSLNEAESFKARTR